MNNVLLLLLLTLSSCAQFSDISLTEDEKGFYAYEDKRELTFREQEPIRDENKKLIRDKEQAEKRLKDLGKLSAVVKNTIDHCHEGKDLTDDFHKALAKLKENKAQKARDLLNKSLKQCETLEYHSMYHYMLAYSYELDNNIDKRDFHLNEFINKADRVFPKTLYQENSPQEEIEIYKRYASHAQEVLTGKKFELDPIKKKHLNISRYRNRLNSFLPGFKNQEGRMFFLLPYYSSRFKGGIQGFTNLNTEFGELIPMYSYDAVRKGLGAITLRKQLSQTVDRKHSIGINFQLAQWRDVQYTENLLTGEISNVKVLDEGIGGSFGYGGTYQFNNDFYYVYQARAYSFKKSGFTGSSLIGYDLFNFDHNESMRLEYGLFNNETIIGLRWIFINIYRNITEDSMNFSLFMGF